MPAFLLRQASKAAAASDMLNSCVTIKSVEEPRVPELDDEFFRTFGVEEGGLEAFHAEVRSNMQRELDAAVANQVKSQVMDELHRLHNVQLPQAMVRPAPRS